MGFISVFKGLNKKAKWIVGILRRNHLLKNVTEKNDRRKDISDGKTRKTTT